MTVVMSWQWGRYCVCIKRTVTLLLLTMCYSFFLFFLFHCPMNICARYYSLETSDIRLKIQHSAQNFLGSWLITYCGNLTYFIGGFRSSKMSYSYLQYTVAATVSLLSQTYFRSVTASPWCCDVTASMLLLSGQWSAIFRAGISCDAGRWLHTVNRPVWKFFRALLHISDADSVRFLHLVSVSFVVWNVDPGVNMWQLAGQITARLTKKDRNSLKAHSLVSCSTCWFYINPFNASWSKLLLFKGFSAILV